MRTSVGALPVVASHVATSLVRAHAHGRATVAPPAQARRLASIVPGARLDVRNGVGYIPHIEDAARPEPLLLQVLARRMPASS